MTFTPQPSIAWEDVEQSLVDWVMDMIGLEAVWAEEDAPEPTMPYVVLDWTTSPSVVGEDYFSQEYVAATREIDRLLEGVRRAVLTVQVMSDSTAPKKNANYFADLLANSLNGDTVVDTYFAPKQMAPWNWEPFTKGDFAQDKHVVSRAGFDITLGFGAGIGEPVERVPIIAGVSITATISNPPTPALSLAGAITS